MNVYGLRARNFRKLHDVYLDLDPELSILVGANNSGKTSAMHAMRLFTLGIKDKFSIHDFSAPCWKDFNQFGERASNAELPKMSIDIWFSIEKKDLHRVMDLLPSLEWKDTLVGIRVELAAGNDSELLARFESARDQALENARTDKDGKFEYMPTPNNLCDYLTKEFSKEYELRYYVLDRAQFDDSFKEKDGYHPSELVKEKGRSGKEILNSLVKVDCLTAQRHLSDNGESSRSEDLSRCLSRFYKRNLDKRADDHEAMLALAQSEEQLNEHFGQVFSDTLARLADLGYPGLANPKLLIRSTLNPVTIMNSHDGARVHYEVEEDPDVTLTLPDQYNGLGYRNLIYMVVELLDVQSQWLTMQENRPPVHVIFIEEPEVHMHAQLQQAFIRKVLEILQIEGDDKDICHEQLVITTHSAHILYERGFKPIRYFRRLTTDSVHSSEILNLSLYHEKAEEDRDFLERYLKLTHCDLFFADAAVLVEGNVERLLMPLMINKSAPDLRKVYLSILEVGGAFANRLRSLIEFLGIPTLIVTDIDSVAVPKEAKADSKAKASSCMTDVPNATTSNQTLKEWIPKLEKVSDLLAAKPDQLIIEPTEALLAPIRVAYQTKEKAVWGSGAEKEEESIAGRTLEEAFAYQNLSWTQQDAAADAGLKIKNCDQLDLRGLLEAINKKVASSNFKKTNFALGLIANKDEGWVVPTYISDGLEWLESELVPVPIADAGAPSKGAAA